MTIQQLQYILEVQRTGSISQAAKTFLVSQACVSNAVSTLEEELGFAVFARGWRGVVPTERGLEVLKNAKQVCEYHSRILKAKEPTAREIRILCNSYRVIYDVFSMLVQENMGRKEVSFSCLQSNTTEAVEKLVKLEADLFVACVNMRRTEIYREQAAALGLNAVVRGNIPLVARIGHKHPLYHKPDLTFDDLQEETYIGRWPLGHKTPTEFGNQIGFAPKRTVIASSQRARQELLDNGVGFSLGPMRAVKKDQREALRCVLVPGADPYQVLCISNPQQPVLPEIQRYQQLLDAKLEEICLPDDNEMI